MTKIVSKNVLVHKIAEGNAPADLIDMLLQKTLPFTEEEYLEGLVFVLKDENAKVKAVSQLKGISESVKATYIERPEANHRVAFFLLLEALNRKSMPIISKIVRNQALPYQFLLKIAEQGAAPMLEVLLDNQIKMIAYPEILDEIERNPQATNFIKGKIKEFRQFYLEEVEAEEIKEEEVMEDVRELLVQQHEQKGKEAVIIEEEAEGEEEEEEGLLDLEEAEQKALTTLQEINAMSISERIKLALTGSKTQRMILVKDANKMVALAVLESPKIGVDEVSLLARNKSVAGEIISNISKRREWTKNYAIILELVHNPKTPIKDALSFVKKLHMRDLQLMSRDKNVNPVVRQLAMNYFNTKSGIKK
jgi:hypothetical protein